MYTISDTTNVHKKHAPNMKFMFNPQKKISMDFQMIRIKLDTSL